MNSRSTKLLCLKPPTPTMCGVKAPRILGGPARCDVGHTIPRNLFRGCARGTIPGSTTYGARGYGRDFHRARAMLQELIMLNAYTPPDGGGIRHHVRGTKQRKKYDVTSGRLPEIIAAVETDEQGYLTPKKLYHLGYPFHSTESPARPGLCSAGTMQMWCTRVRPS